MVFALYENVEYSFTENLSNPLFLWYSERRPNLNFQKKKKTRSLKN